MQIVNFLVLIWVLNMVLYKPIRKILLERKEKMAGLQSDIDGSAREVNAKENSYAEGVKQARAAGQKEKEALMQAAAEEEKAIIRKINESAQAELRSVKTKITQEMGTVKAALEEEVDAFADAIGKKILGRVAL